MPCCSPTAFYKGVYCWSRTQIFLFKLTQCSISLYNSDLQENKKKIKMGKKKLATQNHKSTKPCYININMHFILTPGNKGEREVWVEETGLYTRYFCFKPTDLTLIVRFRRKMFPESSVCIIHLCGGKMSSPTKTTKSNLYTRTRALVLSTRRMKTSGLST